MKTEVMEGLRDVIVANTSICIIDGVEGSLRYRGIDVGEFARHSTYAETAYLLWFGELPTQAQLEKLQNRLVAERELDWGVRKVIQALPKTLQPMEALRTVVSVLPSSDPQANDYHYAANIEKAIRMTAKFPTIVAYYQRHLDDLEFVPPNPELSHAANFLYMLHGQEPTPLEAETMNQTLVLMAEHDFNASTFAARVTASTLSDMYSAITTAVGTLKGPLHGGANQRTMEMMLKIGALENVETYITQELEAKRRIPGFGHRVYRKMADPRAAYFAEKLQALCKEAGDMHWYNMAVKTAQFVGEAKGLYPNVDYFCGPLLYTLGIPMELFTPIFAISRIAGWAAHMIEQYEDNQLLRPLSRYTGELVKEYVPIDARRGTPNPFFGE
ncbi:MAG: citrate synthase [Anaerolineae bacterium]|nr:citrate synthase [Anaerolineae bacterium]